LRSFVHAIVFLRSSGNFAVSDATIARPPFSLSLGELAGERLFVQRDLLDRSNDLRGGLRGLSVSEVRERLASALS